MLARCRVWFEWLASAQNPADGLSRDGWADQYVMQQIRDGVWLAHDFDVDWSLASGDFDRVLQTVAALEV